MQNPPGERNQGRGGKSDGYGARDVDWLKVVFLFAMVMIALAAILWAVSQAMQPAPPQNVQKAQAAQQVQQIQTDLAQQKRDEAWAGTLTTVKWVFVIFLVGAGMIGIVAALVLGVRHFYHKAGLVYAKPDGRLPVHREVLRDPEFVRQAHVGHLHTLVHGHYAQAAGGKGQAPPPPRLPSVEDVSRRPPERSKVTFEPVPVPAGLDGSEAPEAPRMTASPHIEAISPPPPRAALMAPMLTVADVKKAPGIVIGQNPDGSWRYVDELSSGIGGLSGTGKSSTAALIGAQHWYRGGKDFRLLVGDPHMGAEESLTVRLSRMGVQLPSEQRANEPDEILAMVRSVYEEMQKRQRRQRIAFEQSRTIPGFGRIMLMIDEWPSLMRRDSGAELLSILEAIGWEGRKFEIVLALLAQSWLVSASGSSQIRAMPLTIAHRMSRDEYRKLAGRAITEYDIDALPPGTAVVNDADNGMGLVRVPMLQLPPPAPPRSEVKRVPSVDTSLDDEASTDEAPAKGPGSAREAFLKGLEEQDREAIQAFIGGASRTKVLKEIYGLVSSGAKWQQMSDHYEGLLRQYMTLL